MKRGLTRSEDNKMLLGVCAGIGRYLQVDATWVRLGWAVLSLPRIGLGIAAYIIVALVMPVQRSGAGQAEVVAPAGWSRKHWGWLFILAGAVLLVYTNIPLDLLFPWLRGMLWPAVLILAGIYLLVRKS